MPRVTEESARTLNVGRNLYHHIQKNRDGTPLRARVNGKLKKWVKPRNPQWQLPMKYGIKTGFYITDDNKDEWFTHEDEARLFHKGYVIHAMKNNPFSTVVNYWFLTCGSTHLPDGKFPTFEETLAYAVATYLDPAYGRQEASSGNRVDDPSASKERSNG